jgi:hypothetical protein
MTHDELLIEINRRLQVALYNGDPQSIHGLRAVVELHKPEEYTKSEWGIYCPICKIDYPCATIQTIEKELA